MCAERGCWETALKRKSIERALKIEKLDDADRQMLVAYAAALPVGTDDDKMDAPSVSAM